MILLLSAAALFGLAIGSFLNVVIHRVPAGLSIATPASRCPSCETSIRRRHNLPVLGWLLLRGKCADCATPISARYPLVEAGTAVVFVAVTWQVARMGLIAALPAFLVFAAAGIALAAIDLDAKLLPNKIVYPTFVSVIALFTVAAAIDGHWQSLLRAALSAIALSGLFFAIALAQPKGMGLGDVKLAAVIGAVLGFLSYPAVVVGAFAAFFIGSLAGAVLILLRRASRRSTVPFGPSLVAGALLALFLAVPVTNAYASITHLA